LLTTTGALERKIVATLLTQKRISVRGRTNQLTADLRTTVQQIKLKPIIQQITLTSNMSIGIPNPMALPELKIEPQEPAPELVSCGPTPQMIGMPNPMPELQVLEVTGQVLELPELQVMPASLSADALLKMLLTRVKADLKEELKQELKQELMLEMGGQAQLKDFIDSREAPQIQNC